MVVKIRVFKCAGRATGLAHSPSGVSNNDKDAVRNGQDQRTRGDRISAATFHRCLRRISSKRERQRSMLRCSTIFPGEPSLENRYNVYQVRMRSRIATPANYFKTCRRYEKT